MSYKFTSDTFQISASVSETAPNTPTTQTINLNLDSLSREILVIQYVDMDLSSPNQEPGLRTQMNMALTDQPVGVVGLANPAAISVASNVILTGSAPGGTEGASVAFSNAEPRFAQMASDIPLYISATDNLYLSIGGSQNTTFTGLGQVRIFARRARADADTYAAILTSQFN